MSYEESRKAHDDHKYEAAMLRRLIRHEEEVRRNERERAFRRMQPCLMTTPGRVDETGFAPGCTL